MTFFFAFCPRCEIIFTAEHDRSLFGQFWQHHWHQNGNVTTASIHVLFVCFSPSLFVWPRRRFRLMCSSQDWRRSRLLAMGLGWERFDWSALQILQQFICFDLTRCSTLWLACILSSGLQSIPVGGKYYLIHCGFAITNLSYEVVCHQLAAFADQLIFNSTLNARISNSLTYWVSHSLWNHLFQIFELEQPCVSNDRPKDGWLLSLFHWHRLFCFPFLPR